MTEVRKRRARAAVAVMATVLSILAGTGLSSASAIVGTPAAAAATAQPAAAAQPAVGAQAADALTATTNGCNYANAGAGVAEYKDTLCWLDLSGVTTEYQQVGEPIYVNNGGSGWPWNPYSYTATVTFASVLGASYGSVTKTATATSTSSSAAARTQSLTNALSALSDSLYSVSSGARFGNLTNYPITISLANGLTLSAQLDITANGGNAGHYVGAHVFPTWSGAFLGNNGFYEFPTAIKNTVKPAMYQQGSGGVTTANLKNIQLKQNATAVSGYSIVVADAESTDNGESIAWTTNGGSNFSWLPNNPSSFASATTADAKKTAAVGNACRATASSTWNALNTGSQSVTCTAGNSQPSPKTGTPMLQVSPTNAQTSFNVSQQMTGGGLQGVAFGLLMAKTNMTVNIADRVLGTDGNPTNADFSASLTAPLNVTASTGNSTTVKTATIGDQQFPVDSTGTQLGFASSVAGANAASYTPSWVCTKTPSTNGTTWPASGAGSTIAPSPTDPWFKLTPGQYISCVVTYTPPYLTLVKSVNANGTAASDPASAWTLTATGASTVAGVKSGAKLPLAVGSYALTESLANPAWQYGYDWTNLVCTPTAATTTTDSSTGTTTVATANLNVTANSANTCTFTNTARQPKLLVSKSADPVTGTTVDASVDGTDSVVKYKLTFDNRNGTYQGAVDHIDHLRDVLDDATFNAGSVRVSDGSESDYPAQSMEDSGLSWVTNNTDQQSDGTNYADLNPTLAVSGQVPRGQMRTVWFTVTVKQNSADVVNREAEQAPLQGYLLRNYVTPRLDTNGNTVVPPATCVQPTDTATPSTCAEHPIKAWSFSKTSLPVDGARLHKGGNVHYRLAATKLSPETTINGLQLTDDMTQVFKTAGWAPNAAVPGGARSRGIYFFDSVGNSLNADGAINGTSTAPVAAYAGDAGVPAPTYDSSTGRWILKTTTVDVPANAVSAEAWFAVQLAESPVGIPTTWSSTPQSGSKFVNYAAATSATLSPVICGTLPDVSISPSADDPAYEDFPAQCRVTHELRDNFFTIRKDASGVGEDLERNGAWGTDPTGLWNMVGHEFDIQDDVSGSPSGTSSAKLCRSDYNPGTGATSAWDGTFTDTGGTPDWGQASPTLQAIKDWNNSHGTDQQLPLCGLLYAQPEGSGGQTGRWRSENLSEGDYWLIETKAPNEQVSLDGTQRRSVDGVQLLSEPIAFKIWPDADGDPIPVPGNEGQAQKGRGQLDIKNADDSLVGRCLPGADVGDRPVACVNPTGYLMIVKDTVPARLPLTGGQWLIVTLVGGAVVLGGGLGGALWWRRRHVHYTPAMNSGRHV
ncbi:hypothetical protein F8O07_03880 [Pseudoclavibacter sp. CFCC 13796]|uniref:DUF7927 domain-containing protein n=1 Tax=Pseudoclavibacter sp. CFCC 13796 TaxID=2615179 RepID=UPI00130190E6|nr:hypothetical protein [Pseudoclavibacter sp. CFCC 13796]KAB1661105.1 hypothetical protein F8O07_03880 [Pseudoclavibacter sp. CFCC 13796]